MQGPVLVTGGAGYVGAHVVAELAAAGLTPVVLDDFSSSAPAVLGRIEQLTERRVTCIEADVRDRFALRRAFAEHPFAAVVHCAGITDMDEAESRPLACWDVNVGGAIALTEVAGEAGVATLVFSSTAAVYGQPANVPVPECAALLPCNVRGHSYRATEDFLHDVVQANPNWRIAILRCFEVAGAHPSGLLGQPSDRPAALLTRLARVAAGEAPQVVVFGSDWPTPDGSSIRDYLHVQDAAAAHVAALRHLAAHPGVTTLNVGSGRGTSTLELIAAFERACGRRVSCTPGPRRAGQVANCVADTRTVETLLGWRAGRDIDAICADAWRWQKAGGRY